MSSLPKPIKRDPAIVRFSRDHHHALLLVWKIREGLGKNVEPERISNYVVSFFDNELVPHFKDEEVNLFATLPENNEMRVRAESEHKTIREVISSIRENPGEELTLRRFAELLEGHIRFEERELFNFLQTVLSKEELTAIEKAGESPKCSTDNNWSDHFWKS
jgi:hemerythrin-like domain-containing protein